jgi:hypothetical protein
MTGKPSSSGVPAGPDGDDIWLQPDGSPVSCAEKLKVLNENIAEIRDISQEALEDAILMGCDEAQVRAVLRGLIDALDNPYRNGE